MDADTDFGPLGGLVTDGPFAQSRNPLYCAMVAIVPAMALFFDSSWLLMVAPIVPAYLQGIVIPAEEKLLRKTFGSSYKWYSQKVPRWVSFF